MLDADQIALAIEKLERRLAELRQDDPRSEDLIPQTLATVFGPRSQELVSWNGLQIRHADAEYFTDGVTEYSPKNENIKLLESFVILLKERRDELGTKRLIDTAAPRICLNGHVISARASGALINRPGLRCRAEGFCPDCGQAVVGDCEDCGEPLRSFERKPLYCPACGKPYPWTRRAVDAAQALASELEGLSVEERTQLASSVEDVVADTPRTTVAATLIKKLLGKAGTATGKALMEIVTNVASEAAKKILLP